MGQSARYMHVCQTCGRPLAVGETCNCDQPVRWMPKDGLRAKCPLFTSRSSYYGKHYIVCGGRKTPYYGSDQRNEHYRTYCCDAWQTCALIGNFNEELGAKGAGRACGKNEGRFRNER